jgi:CRISPR-associated protein Cmr3
MSTWLIEPRDPLIVRDGKPIGGDARIETMPFPFPSTTAGAVRTRMASPQGEFSLSKDQAKELLKIPVAGPVLAEVNVGTGNTEGFFFPAPRDALVFDEKNKDGQIDRLIVRRLVPHPSWPSGARMDSLGQQELLPIAAAGKEKPEKPFPDAPAYWRDKNMLSWLMKADKNDVSYSLGALGIAQLPTEARMHVSIAPGERVGLDGQLFQTKGLRFVQNEQPKGEPMKWGNVRQLAISIRAEGTLVHDKTIELRPELAPIGGERRLARWQRASKEWPKCPEEVIAAVKKSKTARIVLVTPAVFKKGALPEWSGNPWPVGGNVIATVKGACVGRPEVVSGWDLAKNEPKISRRLAPAGSVYFVQLAGSEDDIAKWARDTWLATVSDEPQDRLDGFGLALVGVWEVGT